MPSKCAGFEDPAGGPAQECTFASDGRGGRAQARKTSDGGRCVFCSIPALEQALKSRLGKRNVIVQLKSWREARSPTYEFALAHSSLVVLDPALVLWLRYCAGERTKFEAKGSWLHKKRKRLARFILGRPASRTPRLSDSAEAFVRHCRYYGQKNIPYGYPKNNQWIELVGKDVVRMNDYGKETKNKQQRWKGPRLWSTSHTKRAHRQAWWRAYRKIRALLRDSHRPGSQPYAPLVTWAMENKITRPARSIRKRKPEKPLDEYRHAECAREAAGIDENSSSRHQTSPTDLPADPLQQVLAEDIERPSSHSRSALPPSQMMLWPQMHCRNTNLVLSSCQVSLSCISWSY